MKNDPKIIRDDLYPYIKDSLYYKSTLLSVAHLRRQLGIGVSRSKRILSARITEKAFFVNRVGKDFYVFNDKRKGAFLERAKRDTIARAKKIQRHLTRFDKWSERFEKSCVKAIEENDLTFDGVAFANESCHTVINLLSKELESGRTYLDEEPLPSDRSRAIAMKIDFFKHYLMAALLENEDGIKKYFELLKQQDPSKTKNNMSFWFGVNPEGTEFDSKSNFYQNSIMLFKPNPYGIDFYRIRNILPYDRICIRHEGGKVWSSKKIKKTVKKIHTDLCLSQKDFDVSTDDDSTILTLNFDPSFPLHMVY